MASITSFLKEPNLDRPAPIIARVAVGGRKVKVYTGLRIESPQAAQQAQPQGYALARAAAPGARPCASRRARGPTARRGGASRRYPRRARRPRPAGGLRRLGPVPAGLLHRPALLRLGPTW